MFISRSEQNILAFRFYSDYLSVLRFFEMLGILKGPGLMVEYEETCLKWCGLKAMMSDLTQILY